MIRLSCVLPLVTASLISSLHCMENNNERIHLAQQLEQQRKKATGESFGRHIIEEEVVIDPREIASTIEAFYSDLETNHNKMFQRFDEIDTDDNNTDNTEAQKRDKLEDLTQSIFSRAQTQKNIAIKAQNYLELHKNRMDDNSWGTYHYAFNEYNMEAQRAIKWAGLYLEFRDLEKDYEHYINQTKTINDRELKYNQTADPYYKESAGRTLSVLKTILNEDIKKISTKTDTLKKKLTDIKEAKDISQETLESLGDIETLIEKVEKVMPISTQHIDTRNMLNTVHNVDTSVMLNNQVFEKKQILTAAEEKVKSWDSSWLLTRILYQGKIKQQKKEADDAKTSLRTSLVTLENFYVQRNINNDQAKIVTVRDDIEKLTSGQ